MQELLVSDEKLDSKEWGATIDKKDGNDVIFKIMPAADAVIGRYKVDEQTLSSFFFKSRAATFASPFPLPLLRPLPCNGNVGLKIYWQSKGPFTLDDNGVRVKIFFSSIVNSNIANQARHFLLQGTTRA